jgi:hypothetical protein
VGFSAIKRIGVDWVQAGWLGGWPFFHFGLKFVVLLCALFYEIMTGKGGFLYFFIIYIFEFDSSL